MVAMATSLRRKVSAIYRFCRPTTQTPSITNCLVAIVHTKPVIAILVPKLVAVATTRRHSISALSSSDSLTLKTHPYNQTACPELSYNQSYSPSKARKPIIANSGLPLKMQLDPSAIVTHFTRKSIKTRDFKTSAGLQSR